MIKNKSCILKITFFLLCCFSTANCSAIETLFNHREQLEKRACTIGATSISNYKGNLLIKEMLPKDLEVWKIRKNEIFDAFLEICYQQSFTSFTAYTSCNMRGLWDVNNDSRYERLGDTLLINLLIETLGELPRRTDEFAVKCLKTIPYPYLIVHRARILEKLKRSGVSSRFHYLAAVIDPPESMRKRLRNITEESNIGLRARLGDKESEKKLIERMEFDLKLAAGMRERAEDRKNFYRFVDSMHTNNVHKNHPLYRRDINTAISELFLCGTNECLKTAVTYFAEFKHWLEPNGCHFPTGFGYKVTPRRLIIEGFRMHHPDLPLLHDDFDDVRTHFARHSGTDMTEKIITTYLEKFINWGNKKYGTNAKLKDKILFSGQCDREIFYKNREREKR